MDDHLIRDVWPDSYVDLKNGCSGEEEERRFSLEFRLFARAG